jgi:hypothetical protein
MFGCLSTTFISVTFCLVRLVQLATARVTAPGIEWSDAFQILEQERAFVAVHVDLAHCETYLDDRSCHAAEVLCGVEDTYLVAGLELRHWCHLPFERSVDDDGNSTFIESADSAGCLA